MTQFGMHDCDVCVIGSGAGGGPVAHTLSRAGRSVIVLEKGPWFREGDFSKDEIADCRRNKFTPDVRKEPHVVELLEESGWESYPTYDTGWNFWNGNMVGGASNIMSGFFQRLKPVDFRLRSEFGPINDADVRDWPIDYNDLEPYYDRVEQVVGISGRIVPHPLQEPRSKADFPLPPLAEHPLANWIDEAGKRLGLHPVPLPRAILTIPRTGRVSCSYSHFCGNYGCATGAKGSSRAALLNDAVASGRCEVRPKSMVQRLESDTRGRVVAAQYLDENGVSQRVAAKIFVVACQPVETARLLLLSTGAKHPDGLGNGSGLVGRYIVYSTAASAEGAFPYAKFSPERAEQLRQREPFINRTIDDYYVFKDPKSGVRKKGGTLDFMFVHPNPISVAVWYALRSRRRYLWGRELKRELECYFRGARHVTSEIFCDWLPTADSRVTLDPTIKDRWGQPVARVRIGEHPQNKQVADFLVKRAKEIFRELGAANISGYSKGGPATNLTAGGCRFGKDPKSSVLNTDCRMHEVENVYVTDGSFMPTGGSVPYTWTIYANSFRVAERIALAI